MYILLKALKYFPFCSLNVTVPFSGYSALDGPGGKHRHLKIKTFIHSFYFYFISTLLETKWQNNKANINLQFLSLTAKF